MSNVPIASRHFKNLSRPDSVAKFDQLREQKNQDQLHVRTRAAASDFGSIFDLCRTKFPAGAKDHGGCIGVSPHRSSHRRESFLALRLFSRPSCSQSTSSSSVRGDKFELQVLNHRGNTMIVSETYLSKVACLARDDVIMDMRHLLALEIDA